MGSPFPSREFHGGTLIKKALSRAETGTGASAWSLLTLWFGKAPCYQPCSTPLALDGSKGAGENSAPSSFLNLGLRSTARLSQTNVIVFWKVGQLVLKKKKEKKTKL